MSYKTSSSKASTGRGKAGEDQFSRLLFYPKIKFRITFVTDRQFVGYISVRTRISPAFSSSHEFALGTTESRTKDFGTDNNILFHKGFEVPYQIGVDDMQSLILDIYDGDHTQTNEGYLMATAQFPVIQLARPTLEVRIRRGNTDLGCLVLSSIFDVDCQEAILDNDHEAMVKAGKQYSSIPGLNSADYFDDVVMGFFPYQPPTLHSISYSNPFISNVKSYRVEFGLNAEKICPLPKKVMKRNDSCVFLKLCCYSKKEGDRNPIPWSENLQVLWTSLTIEQSPYDIVVDRLTIQLEEIAGANRVFVFQVYITNWDDLVATVPPRVICYCELSKEELLGIAGKKELTGEAEESSIELSPPGSLKLKFLRPSIGAGDKFFAKIREFRSKGWRSVFSSGGAAGKVKDIDDLALEEENMFPAPEVRDEDDDVIDEYDGESSEKCGNLTIQNLFLIKSEGDVGPGDSRYDHYIRKMFLMTRKNWTTDMQILFQDHATDQSHRIFLMSSVFNGLLAGFKLNPYVVVDMGFPCVQNLIGQVSAMMSGSMDKKFDSLFAASNVLNVVNTLYNSAGLMNSESSLKVFAGGAVCVPPDEYLAEMQSEGKTVARKARHWAAGLSRLCGFPLCEELVAAELLRGARSLSRVKAQRARLLKRHEGLTYWGGCNYALTAKYSSTTELIRGAMEAAVIYHPQISKEALDTAQNGKEANQTAHQEDVIKERYIFAVGPDHPSCGPQFWAQVPNSLESVSTEYNFDIDAIQELLEKPVGEDESGIVFWVLGHSPSHSCLTRLDKMLKNLLAGRDRTGTRENPNKNPCLMIILAAEVQQKYAETSVDALKSLSNPFESFFQEWYYALKDNEYVMEFFRANGIKERSTDGPASHKYRSLCMPRLALYHHCSWAEVVAAAYVKEMSTVARTVTTFVAQNPTDDVDNTAATLSLKGAQTSKSSSRKVAGGAQDPVAAESTSNGPVLSLIFDVIKHKFNRTEDLQCQYLNVPEFRKVVSSENPYDKVAVDDIDEDGEESSHRLKRADLSKIRVSMAGNAEMKRRFELESEKLLRAAVIKFVAESMELRQNAGIGSDSFAKGKSVPGLMKQEKDCVGACSVS